MARRAESLALGAAAALVLAFIVSFVAGLSGGEAATQPAEPVVTQDVAPEPAARVSGRLEVLNSAGRPGLARRATDELRAAGFDVVYFGNASASASDSSVVIDRGGGPAIARSAADRLGITRVTSRPDSTLLVDATVIVGVDWRMETPRAQDAARDSPWNRIRRVFGR